jgi:hypothetical protein
MPSTVLESQYILLPKDSTANRPGSPSVGMVRYNTTSDNAEVYSTAGWGGFGSPIGTSGNPALSGSQLYNDQPGAAAGLYFFKNANGTSIQTYCDIPGGGWVLVASNNASSSTIPFGNSRQSSSYWVGRSGGSLGTSNPDNDWIIGDWLDTFTFTEARCVIFGVGTINGSTSWSSKGTTVTATWTVGSSGTGRYTNPVARGSVSVTGSLAPAASYFVLDGVRTDFNNGGYDANSQQTTIGAVGVGGSSGDPSTGCYMGHGSGGNEDSNSHEGLYTSNSSATNCQGYTTWVR